MKYVTAVFIAVVVMSFFSTADTFTNTETGQVINGYRSGKADGGTASVKTEDGNTVEINLAQWEVEPNRKGRNNKVPVITIDGGIMHEIETAAFEGAIQHEADLGPLFILVELDTPGGRVDLAQRISAVITDTDNAEVIVFIKGGESGGALSAGVAISLAANKIYMADNTVIGAATMITGHAQTMKKAFGEDVGEKFDSAWRARLASLAEKNGRPGLLARAMVDKDIEVIEVEGKDSSLFIDPVNKKSSQSITKTWSKKGSLLTLTAEEAAGCGFTDATVSSRQELLKKESAQQAELVINDDVQKAAKELERAKGQLARIRKSVDLKVKKYKMPMYRAEALKILRDARKEFKSLLKLAKKYPDLGLSIQLLEDELNSIEAAYLQMKRQSRRR